MTRRNLFNPPAPPAPAPGTDAPAEALRPRFPNTGAMSGMKSALRDLSSNAMREIAPEMIEEDGPKDRLPFTDADVAALADSIRQHGQQVPILVRPLPDRPGHYRIVYGRRRLRALRLLGIAAKALVRSVSDDEAVLAQGQENAQRLDPSFIEKALFAGELAGAGYDPAIILDALAIDKPMLSRMHKVARSIPAPVIGLIGPAHGIGRRRWEDLADAAKAHGADITALAQAACADPAQTSEDRFARVLAAVLTAVHTASGRAAPAAPALPVRLKDGTLVAEISETARALILRLPKTGPAEFTRWMRTNAPAELVRLYAAWQATRGAD